MRLSISFLISGALMALTAVQPINTPVSSFPGLSGNQAIAVQPAATVDLGQQLAYRGSGRFGV
jgi:hypothetical protein